MFEKEGSFGIEMASKVINTKKRRKHAEEKESRKERKDQVPVAAAAETVDASTPSTSYPPSVPPTGNVSLLLFYAYCQPQMTKSEQDAAIERCHTKLSSLGERT